MKVQVTKVMANLLNKEIPEFTFRLEKHSTGWWSDLTDYDCKTGLYTLALQFFCSCSELLGQGLCGLSAF